MKTRKKSEKKALRERAEQFLVEHPESFEEFPSKDLRSLIHELEVHQIELEMQNDELRNKQAELEESRSRYVDLYEFAPVGYFILDRKGGILDANLTGARLLGLARGRVVGRPFTVFLSGDSSPLFLRHMMEVFSGNTRQTCELVIKERPAKATRYVSLESITVGAGDNARMRSAVIDVTERRLAEEVALRAQQELAEANERLRHLSERLLVVQEEERRRVAYEVHDAFSSALAAMRIRVSRMLANSENRKDLEEVPNQLKAIMEEARRIQQSLRPSAFDDIGLVAALNSLSREFRRSNPGIFVETEFRVEELEIREPVRIQIFRIAQEALSNIAKHAGADSARLSLTGEDSSINLVISDNGRGFNVREALSRDKSRLGLGLSIMKERATLSGGAFNIESRAGKGTSLRVAWSRN